ncbi:MAG: hypothetical protein U1F11_03595 [Steroidobacteraceae bacterium]
MAAGQHHAGDGIPAVLAQVVHCDESAEGPADDPGPLQAEPLDHGAQVARPRQVSRVGRRIPGLAGSTVAAQVERDQPEAAGQFRIHELLVPAQVALRVSMQQQDRYACRITRLDDVERHAVPGCNLPDRERRRRGRGAHHRTAEQQHQQDQA